jgi:2-polyprenyl-6-methoxyphenol hydroxylase-like FAD-dependent oxidoreductase
MALSLFGQCGEQPLAWTADAACATPLLSDFLSRLPRHHTDYSKLCSESCMGEYEVDRTMLDALIVGAGPTGLTLAAGLARFGVQFRGIDRALDRAHESRALGVQARSLEILQSLGLGEALVRRGNASARLFIHLDLRRAAEARLGDFGETDTRFPFILFVSQAETEAVLGDHLARKGVVIERGVELLDAVPEPDCVRCLLRHPGGREEQVQVRYLAGCDGARSIVRKQASIPFEGDAYVQDFMLGDVEVDGPLECNALHSFALKRGIAVFFPLGSPTTWRVIGASGASGRSRTLGRGHERAAPPDAEEAPDTGDLSLEELQKVVDDATGGGLVLRDPAWLSHFRLHHRQAAHYRAGRIFLAGDAAHIHSPVGAQGMNTGIQDAWNLAWKLALVIRGNALHALLDSYEAERWPVGRRLLRYTDRLFTVFTRAISGGRLATWFRRVVVARLLPVLPRIFASSRLRAYTFHLVSQLGIRYRNSPAVAEGEPRLQVGPSAGDRLPDAEVEHNGRQTYLQQELAGASLHLLLCGARDGWDQSQAAAITARHSGLVVTHHLTARSSPDVLVDTSGEVLSRLGVRGAQDSAQYLVRPDGHVAFRCAGRDFVALMMYLDRWLPSSTPRVGG